MLFFSAINPKALGLLIVLKSLIYFDDANNEPDPISIDSTNWTNVKEKISLAVNCFGK